MYRFFNRWFFVLVKGGKASDVDMEAFFFNSLQVAKQLTARNIDF